jgi:hypothetical protein
MNGLSSVIDKIAVEVLNIFDDFDFTTVGDLVEVKHGFSTDGHSVEDCKWMVPDMFAQGEDPAKIWRFMYLCQFIVNRCIIWQTHTGIKFSELKNGVEKQLFEQ